MEGYSVKIVENSGFAVHFKSKHDYPVLAFQVVSGTEKFLLADDNNIFRWINIIDCKFSKIDDGIPVSEPAKSFVSAKTTKKE